MSSPEELRVLGVDLSPFSSAGRFLICSAGVFVFFLLHGFLQEALFSLEGFGPYGWYLTLVQFGLYSLFGLLERRLTRGEDKRRRAGAGGGGVPVLTYMKIALLTVASLGLANTSLGYLSYPTQVVFKSCKLVSVMVGAVFIQGKRYGAAEVSAALCMTLGLAWFTLADSKVASGGLDGRGLLLVGASLCADAAMGNMQEKAMRRHGGSNAEMLLYSYSIGFLYVLAGLCGAGGLAPAVAFCREHRPGRTYGYMFLMSLSGYVGVSFVLALVKHFGALAATTVTTGRKAATVVLSFLVFAKPFTLQYVWGGLLVLLGIYLNLNFNGQNANNMKLPAV